LYNWKIYNVYFQLLAWRLVVIYLNKSFAFNLPNRYSEIVTIDRFSNQPECIVKIHYKDLNQEEYTTKIKCFPEKKDFAYMWVPGESFKDFRMTCELVEYKERRNRILTSKKKY